MVIARTLLALGGVGFLGYMLLFDLPFATGTIGCGPDPNRPGHLICHGFSWTGFVARAAGLTAIGLAWNRLRPAFDQVATRG